MSAYKSRIVDAILQRKLEAIGAVLLQGPRSCGKTTTGEKVAKSVIYMTSPEGMTANIDFVSMQPQKLLKGATPRLIDEWQIAPRLWDVIRFEVDHRQLPGQFILTGSAVPAATEKIFHSGTGRIARLNMRTMTLFESGESNGEVALKSLFDGDDKIEGISELCLEDIAYLICRGGWPASLNLPKKGALKNAHDYVESIAKSELLNVGRKHQNAKTIKALLRTYAQRTGTSASVQVMQEDLETTLGKRLAENTIIRNLEELRKIFVIEDLPAWRPSLQTKTPVRSAPARYLTDPSIASAALGLSPENMWDDLNAFTLLFKTLAVRDLRVYAQSLDGCVYHYRDKTGDKIDAVVECRNGRYGLIEIKLGASEAVEYGASTLKKVAGKLDTTKMKEPSFLMVLTGVGRYAYKREDGVLVVPIGCLKN